jgi:hypothetical protein
VAAIFDAGTWLARGRTAAAPTGTALTSSDVLLAALGLLIAIGIALPKTLKPLHAHRLGHRQAGEWLAARWQPGDHLADPYGWVRFYSGEILTTLNRQTVGPAAQRHYLVMEPGDPDEDRQRVIKTVSDRLGIGNVVYAWPDWARPRVVIREVSEAAKASGLVAVPVEQSHQR